MGGGGRGLRLLEVRRALALTFGGALIVAAGVFVLVRRLLGAHALEGQPELSSSTLFDLIKLSFGVVAGAGGLVALVVAYRKQRVDEEGSQRDTTRLHTERFIAAVGQLGADNAAVRLGGVHALAGLADDAPTRALRQTVIDVLCAYLRLPYAPDPGDDQPGRAEYLANREVRHTIIRLIRDHLRYDKEQHSHSWQGHDFDFTNTIFDGGDFNEAEFTGGTVDFFRTAFNGGTVDVSDAEGDAPRYCRWLRQTCLRACCCRVAGCRPREAPRRPKAAGASCRRRSQPTRC